MNRKSQNLKQTPKPRKIPVIKPSKYEFLEAYHRNKRYWNEVVSKLEHKVLSPRGENAVDNIYRELPLSSFRNVCFTLKLKPNKKKGDEDELEETVKKEIPKIRKEVYVTKRKTVHLEREADSDTDVEVSPRECPSVIEYTSKDEEEKIKPDENVYYDFLNKPEREAVTWASRYLEPEREDEKSLERRADELTHKIATEFAEYMKQLGGDQTSQLFTTKAIKELYDVEFNKHAAHSLQIVPREMPAILDHIANLTKHYEVSRTATLVREIKKDIIAESKPAKIMGFGSYLSHEQRWIPPNNDTKNVWCTSSNVPIDTVTLKTVWEGITNLKSVKEFCRWIIEHPEYRRAPYLNSLGMFDPATLDARFTMDSQARMSRKSTYDHHEPIAKMRQRLSTLASADVDVSESNK